MRNGKLFATLVLISGLLLVFCGGGDGDGDGDDNPVGPGTDGQLETEARSGAVYLPENSTLTAGGMEVVTFAGLSSVSDAGSFSVDANKADNFQMLLGRPAGGLKPALLGLFDPVSKVTVMNDSTTALALTMMNPYLAYAGHSEKALYMDEVRRSDKFAALLTLINDAHGSDAAGALDYTKNPGTFQKAAELMEETMLFLGGAGNTPPVKSVPRFESAGGGKLNFYNSRQITYVAGVYGDRGELKEIVTIGGKEENLTYGWGWPPIVQGGENKTDLSLTDGTYNVKISKGTDFTKFSSWGDPEGRATAINTGKAVLRLVELAIGKVPDADFEDLTKLVGFTPDRAADLNRAMSKGNAEEFLAGMAAWIGENKAGISDWIWGGSVGKAEMGAKEDFLGVAAEMLGDMALVLELLGLTNEDGPLFWDYVFSPAEVNYSLTMQGGSVTTSETNDAPVAGFTVDPPAGVVGTSFAFDASSSSDDRDSAGLLLFRWDWESDGTWDREWSGSAAATHSYAEGGAWIVTLEVKDTGGLVGAVTHTLNVGGGAGTATHVKLFRDNLPWSTNATAEVLEDLGFTEGSGPNTYEIVSSDSMGSVALVPGEDLVIISNDQAQSFYDAYAQNQVRFTNFIYTGGSLFWGACDKGWNQGDIAVAGIILPGDVTILYNYDRFNYVTSQALPLVAGLSDTLEGNSASHESFGNLPDGTTVYCENESSLPTLVEYNQGGGWVILTGQPLEHQYANANDYPDMGKLLPRIVAYFTGKPYEKRTPAAVRSARGRPSSGTGR